jgi:hypothetical protein
VPNNVVTTGVAGLLISSTVYNKRPERTDLEQCGDHTATSPSAGCRQFLYGLLRVHSLIGHLMHCYYFFSKDSYDRCHLIRLRISMNGKEKKCIGNSARKP